MTGIAIITAGREDAYQDYLQSVKRGHDPSMVEEFLTEDYLETVTDSETEQIHLWGTSVDSKWQSVTPGDIALVYREGRYIAQATVVETADKLDLAERLWRTEGNPWDPESPWRYLIFLTGVEEIEVGIDAFNELVGYEEDYRPQGFSRVADFRIEALEEEYESVETAINELTGTGVRVHEIDDDEPEEDDSEPDLGQRIVNASNDGTRDEELEQLVAKAFSRMGFEARWIEGGGDTDVEVTAPIHAIVDTKARSNGTLSSPDAARIEGHRDQHMADHAIIVAPGFTPAAIDDADRQGIILLSTDHLQALVTRREIYGVPSESIARYLTEPGAFQDDRLDQLDDEIRARLNGTEDLLSVMEALQRANPEEGTADDLRLILKGMYADDKVPELKTIEQSLHFLAHPSIGLAKDNGEKYQAETTTTNAKALLRRFGNLVEEIEET